MLESKFQSGLIKDLKKMFPGCIVLKNDPNYLQGIPDLSVFWQDKWAMLEVKKEANASHQPNQDYYVIMLTTCHSLDLSILKTRRRFYVNFNNHSDLKDLHAFLSPSNYHWLNYSSDKLETIYHNSKIKEEGTLLHAFASMAIIKRIKLANIKKALNQFVNDSIGFKMESEKVYIIVLTYLVQQMPSVLGIMYYVYLI
jgi:hypothetical protein